MEVQKEQHEILTKEKSESDAAKKFTSVDQVLRTYLCTSVVYYRTAFYSDTWDRCYDFLNIFAEKFSKEVAFLIQNKAKLCKKFIITLVFEKKRQFFRQKLSEIAENCDHNIGPWSQSYDRELCQRCAHLQRT
jgi:hypothetical protein